MQNYQMIDVGNKKVTRRICLARGKLIATPSTIQRIRTGELPKGNVLPLAEAAGITAVKNTSTILPLCHPLPIDAAYVRFEFEANAVHAFCEVSAEAKTGVEMEALNGVMAALLCIYDLTKGIDPVLEISDIHLVKKEGGKSGQWTHPKNLSTPVETPVALWKDLRLSVITLSDRCSQGLAKDTSGPKIAEYGESLGARNVEYKLIPDSVPQLKEALQSFLKKSDLVICTGGTGLGPHDITPETIQSMDGKTVPGIGEVIRSYGSMFTPFSYLSRSEGFLLDQTLVICLPGSFKAVKESLDAIAKIIPHAIHMIRGDSH